MGRKAKVKRSNAVIPPKPSLPLSVSLSKPFPSRPNAVSNNSIVTPRQVPINKGVRTTDIMKKTIRERIIHILALRPYKKPEIIARLIRDGVKEKEKKGISAILCQIAQLNNNTYHLTPCGWNEIQDNWPFYTPEEAETIRKKRRQTPMQNENRIPSPSIMQPNSSPVQKRSIDYEMQANKNKKQRISHYNRPDNASSNSNPSFPSRNDSSGTLNGTVMSSGTINGTVSSATINGTIMSAINGTISSEKSKDVAEHFPKKEPLNNNIRAYNTQPMRHENPHHRINNPKVSSTTNGSCGSSPRTSPDSQDSMDYCGSENDDHSSPSSDFDGYDFLKQYGGITSLDQRARYKADFNAVYEEYRYLHAEMKNVSKRFAALEDQLNAYEEGSTEWHRIKGQIYREYEDNKHDPKYQDIRGKFNYLQRKLSHIKRLVMEYDNAQAIKS